MYTLTKNPSPEQAQIVDDLNAVDGVTDPGVEEDRISAAPESEQAPRVTGAGALALLIGGFYAFVGSGRLSDNSFLTHLATGREILDSGLPATNPFLYSSTSFPVPSYWWSIVLGAVEKIGSGGAIRLLTAILAGVLGALIVRLGAYSAADVQSAKLGDRTGSAAPERTILAVLVPTLLATLCVMPFLSSRPHLPGFILLALSVLVWNERRSVWWMVPIFAIWVNVHGTWLYGIAVLGLFFVAEVIESLRIDTKRLSAVLCAIGGTVLGGALYPNPFEIMLLPTRQFGSDLEREAIRMYIEWKPVTTDSSMFWLLIGLGLVAVYGNIAGASGGSGDGTEGAKRRWASAISAVGLVLLGLSANRLVPIAAIALAPLVSSSLSNLGSIPMFRGRVAKVVAVVGAGLIMAGIVNSFVGPAYQLDQYPVAMVERMAAHDVIGGDVRTLTHDYVGNYLEWRLGNRSNTYVDDRPGAQTFVNYGKMLKLKDGWQDALADADPDVIIWKKSEKLTRELKKSDEWVHAKKIKGWDLFCSPRMAKACAGI